MAASVRVLAAAVAVAMMAVVAAAAASGKRSTTGNVGNCFGVTVICRWVYLLICIYGLFL